MFKVLHWQHASGKGTASVCNNLNLKLITQPYMKWPSTLKFHHSLHQHIRRIKNFGPAFYRIV